MPVPGITKDIFYGHTLKHNVGLIVVLCIGLELRLHDSKAVGIHQRVAIIGNFDYIDRRYSLCLRESLRMRNRSQ